METVKKPKIEAIYPLTNMQQGLLFHHLISNEDQGFLHVQCKLEGKLDIENLKTSWQAAVKRHAILRTSVHWKNVEKPIQVVRPDKTMNWHHHNWVDTLPEEIDNRLSTFKNTASEREIHFEKGPLSKINLIQTEENVHYLIWNCHHLLLDGWSCSILLQDVFSFYESNSTKTKSILETVPSYKTYLNWLQKVDTDKAASFWKNAFANFKTPPLFNPQQESVKDKYVTHHMAVSKEETEDLQSLARHYRITSNSLFQGIWSILLNHYFGTKDVTFGTTVSGRSASFPNVELMTGMFMNVLPVRAVLEETIPIMKLFQEIQSKQQEAREHEHFTNDQITSWIDWPMGIPLFDNLLIFENFPWKDINSAGIQVREFESGITTTYPVTLTIKATVFFDFHLLVNSEMISDKAAKWLLDNLKLIVNSLIENKDISLTSLLAKLETLDRKDFLNKEEQKNKSESKKEYVGPQNEMELQLMKIWENIFGNTFISINDNFFELGGKSLLAVKMFTLIEHKLGVKTPPATLLENPTIASMAKVLNGDKKTSSWNYLVPIRASGTKKPLFCIHAGGGHVFFYNPLANHLEKDRPVYAIQPSGIFGKKNMHRSIEEMAIDYTKEIRLIQPEGPYNIVVYCFSTAVGLEMAIELNKQGQEANLIVADSLAMQENLNTSTRLKMRILGFGKRFLKNPVNGVSIMITDRINRHIKPRLVRTFGASHDKTIAKLKMNLFELYTKYNWKTYSGRIALILTHKADKTINKEFINSWEKLTTDTVDVTYTNGGDHRTLFDDSDVKFIAEKIENCIIEGN